MQIGIFRLVHPSAEMVTCCGSTLMQIEELEDAQALEGYPILGN